MATQEEVTEVRLSSATVDDTATFTDEILGSLIDMYGVKGAIARVWTAKAAQNFDSVDVSEAGARHNLSDAFEHARRMALDFDEAAEKDLSPSRRGVVISRIVRE